MTRRKLRLRSPTSTLSLFTLGIRFLHFRFRNNFHFHRTRSALSSFVRFVSPRFNTHLTYVRKISGNATLHNIFRMKSLKLLAALLSVSAIAAEDAANVSTVTVASPVSTRTHTNIVYVTESAGPNVNNCSASLCAPDNSKSQRPRLNLLQRD